MNIYVSHCLPTAEPNRLSFFEVTQIKRGPWGKSNYFIPRATHFKLVFNKARNNFPLLPRSMFFFIFFIFFIFFFTVLFIKGFIVFYRTSSSSINNKKR